MGGSNHGWTVIRHTASFQYFGHHFEVQAEILLMTRMSSWHNKEKNGGPSRNWFAASRKAGGANYCLIWNGFAGMAANTVSHRLNAHGGHSFERPKSWKEVVNSRGEEEPWPLVTFWKMHKRVSYMLLTSVGTLRNWVCIRLVTPGQLISADGNLFKSFCGKNCDERAVNHAGAVMP